MNCIKILMALDTKSKEEADKWGEKTVPMAPSIWNFKAMAECTAKVLPILTDSCLNFYIWISAHHHNSKIQGSGII